jgi:hypothetical protein
VHSKFTTLEKVAKVKKAQKHSTARKALEGPRLSKDNQITQSFHIINKNECISPEIKVKDQSINN